MGFDFFIGFILLSLLIFIDFSTRLIYLWFVYRKIKIDYIFFVFFRLSLIFIVMLLGIKVLPNSIYFIIGFLIYFLFSPVIWRFILKYQQKTKN
ncbi:MAG: hypothetical protein N2485_04680 [bacterium]|nr:hypothetical protein [bacterium]